MIIFIYDYLNKRTKDFVDKRFYKERYNYRQSLLDISKEIQSTKDIISTLKKLSDLIENKIGAESFVIWLKDEKYYKLLDDIHSPNQVYNKNKIDKITGEIIYKCIEIKNAPVIFNEIELANMNLADEEINTLNSKKIMLAIPLRLKNSIIGCFIAGDKKSGRTYSTEDIDLLTTISSHVTIALENLKLQLEEIEKQKILEELEIAEDIQKSLLPSDDLAVNNLEISGVSIPAKSVGGDFFDYIHLSNNKLLVVVADVSGKGIPAALYMAKFQAVVQFASNIIENPGDILTELNNQIYSRLDRNYFITMCIAIFDFDKNVVSIYRAGHPPAIVITDEGINIVKTKGIGLGLEQDKIFKVNLEPSEFILNKNNIILLYSDGLTEAFNNKLDSYGIERAIDLLKQEKSNNSKTILNNLIIDVNNFRNGAEQNDDITCVVIKIN